MHRNRPFSDFSRAESHFPLHGYGFSQIEPGIPESGRGCDCDTSNGCRGQEVVRVHYVVEPRDLEVFIVESGSEWISDHDRFHVGWIPIIRYC